MKYTIFTIVMFLVFAGSVLALDMKGLVLYLPFNEGSGTIAKDASGNGNNGEIKGKVDWVAGKFGKAVKVNDSDANSLVSVKGNAKFDLTDAISYGAWVYIESMPDNHCSLITKADTYMIHMSNWSGKGIEMEPLLWPFDKWQTEISAPIQLKEWRHVMGVFDGKELKTYVDGAFKAKRAFASKIAVTTNDVVIGRDSRACCITRKATMTIDNVTIFGRALTDDEVKELAAGELTPVDPQGSVTTLWGEIKSK